jgi:hypothetical protein
MTAKPKPSDRLYMALALIDRRDGTWFAGLVRAAREGYERAGMGEDHAWAEFDALWHRKSSAERLRLTASALSREEA